MRAKVFASRYFYEFFVIIFLMWQYHVCKCVRIFSGMNDTVNGTCNIIVVGVGNAVILQHYGPT